MIRAIHLSASALLVLASLLAVGNVDRSTEIGAAHTPVLFDTVEWAPIIDLRSSAL